MPLELAWESRGTGPETLVLVHGYTGSQRDFAGVVEPLSEHCRVVTVDLPGHGESPRLPEYTLDGLTSALLGFLLELDAGPVHLLGHSMGGRVVLPIAIDRRELVHSVVLMDTWADHGDRGEAGQRLDEVFSLPDEAVLPAAQEFWDDWARPEHELVVASLGHPAAEARNQYNDEHVDPAAVIQLGRHLYMGAPSLLERCDRIDCPTTVLLGANDEWFIDSSYRMATTIPGARLVVIDGAYHSPQLTHPGQWLEAITSHLTRAGG